LENRQVAIGEELLFWDGWNGRRNLARAAKLEIHRLEKSGQSKKQKNGGNPEPKRARSRKSRGGLDRAFHFSFL
jgi:hypothetical protein